MPPPVPTDPAANVQAGVTAYFLGGEQNLLYVEVDGQWVEYVKSAPPSGATAADAPAALTTPGPHPQGGRGMQPGTDNQTGPVHWAGYTCHSPDEITRERPRRVYHDPATRADLLLTGTGGAPALPLPVLELAGPLEDPAPWLDPESGERFSSDRASLVLKLLRYAPRKPFTAPGVWYYTARSHGGFSLPK
ncbi:hypothetical protein ACFRAU_08635 [Arthrobacter sp. NPDC056691]|uniref:hypothetical protein n=1 Tax=Arthrobacter sp. NPDC056691 TaxID=3345913 RepID=UPI0036710879